VGCRVKGGDGDLRFGFCGGGGEFWLGWWRCGGGGVGDGVGLMVGEKGGGWVG